MVFKDLHKNRFLLSCTLLWLFLFVANSGVKAQDNPDYHGHRLQVYSIQVMKEGKDFYQIRFNIANTGRKDLDISQKKPLPFLTLDYDHTLFENKLGSYRENIRRVMTTSDVKLKVGKVTERYLIRFSKLLPEDTIRNPFPATIITENAVNRRKDSKTVIEEKPVKMVAEIIKEEAQCFDFQIDTVKIIDRNAKWLTLEYTLVNASEAPAPMLGMTKDEKDNLAIRAFISGAPKMSKGALVFGGTFVENMEKGAEGKIPPGKRFSATFRLDMRDKSRYMNYLILSLDPFQTVQECDERNNIYVVDLTN